MALFHVKSACNLAISNPVFRWESCKASVWESVKKCSRLCKVAGTRDLDSRVACGWQAAKWCTRVKHAEKMNSHASWSTIGQKVQSGNSVYSQLELVTQSSREAKPLANSVLKNLTLRIPFSLQYIYPSYPRNIKSFQREYWERNPKEKLDWLIYNFHIENL